MENKKRMAGDYEIKAAVRIGEREIIYGENPESDHPYLCAFCRRENFIIEWREIFEEAIASDDYLDTMELFSKRVAESCEKMREEISKITVPTAPITEDMCYKNDYNLSLVGKVVAIETDVFRPEYRRADRQLVYVTGGNGAVAGSPGRACFTINLYDGEEDRFERYEVQGEVKPEHLPDWAKKRLAEIQKEQAEKERKQKNRNGKEAR